MFQVFLKFSDNKTNAGQFMEAHNAWLKQGFDDGEFLFVGSVLPNLGGTLMAYNITFTELQERVNADPFVTENVVVAEIIEVDVKTADERLSFLLD